MEQIFTVLGCLVLITLSLAISRQLSEQKHFGFPSSVGAPYSKYGDNRLENFSNPADFKIGGDYTLINSDQKKKINGSVMTAQTCYENDFLAQTQKTGNYIQRTNNFKHEKPDACSAPLEFVGNFY